MTKPEIEVRAKEENGRVAGSYMNSTYQVRETPARIQKHSYTSA
jgi:hypothetical protein